MYLQDEPAGVSTTRVRDAMAGSTTTVEGVFKAILTLILPKIIRQLTSYSLIEFHQINSFNAASVASNLRGGGATDTWP